MTWTDPVVTAQVAPGFSPYNPPGGGDWVDLPPVLSFTSDRGKQDTLGEFMAGTAEMVLDNSALDLDQLVSGSIIEGADGLPGTPVRLKVVYNGTTTYRGPWFTIDGWNPVGERWAARVSVALTDWLGWAATVPLPESPWASWVTHERPDTWIRGTTNTYETQYITDRAYNAALRWDVNGDFQGNAGTYTGQNYQVSGIVTDSSQKAILQRSLAGVWAGWIAPGAIAASGQWAVAIWIKLAAPQVQYYGTSGGGDIWWIGTDGAGQIVANVKVSGVLYSTVIAANHCDAEPHLVYMEVDSTNANPAFRVMSVYSDLGNSTFIPIAGSANSGGGTIELNGRSESVFQDFVYWTGWPSSPHTAGPASWVPGWVAGSGGASLWFADDWADRLGRYMNIALVTAPTTEITVDNPSLPFYYFEPSSTLAEAVRTLAGSLLGACWITRDGALRIRDATFTSSSADDYTTSQALISDDPAAAGPPTVVRASAPALTPTRADRVVNDMTVSGIDGTAFVHAQNVGSQIRYGVRSKTMTSHALAVTPTYVGPFVDAYVAAHADPPTEVGEITVDVWGNADHADFVLNDLELERVVTLRVATPDNVSELINADYRVIGEKWAWNDGTKWTVSLRLEPV